MAEPISDEALADFRQGVETGRWPDFQSAHDALLARLDAAEARAVPEGWKVEWRAKVLYGDYSDRPYLVPVDTEGEP